MIKQCPACGMTAAVLDMTGKVGCPECYAYFQQEIVEYLNGAADFIGGRCIPGESYMDLMIQLQKAVEKEDYEQAAVLRDKIHALKENSCGLS